MARSAVDKFINNFFILHLLPCYSLVFKYHKLNKVRRLSEQRRARLAKTGDWGHGLIQILTHKRLEYGKMPYIILPMRSLI